VTKPPAGWYPDPDGTPDRLRYWRESTWSDWTREHGEKVSHPLPDRVPKRAAIAIAATWILGLLVTLLAGYMAAFQATWESTSVATNVAQAVVTCLVVLAGITAAIVVVSRGPEAGPPSAASRIEVPSQKL
jgi:hypothetical protein